MKLISEKHWIQTIHSLKTPQKSDKSLLKKEIISAIKLNIPQKRFGILFSGGVDSSLIAIICKQSKADFICYSVGLENSKDIEAAKKAAKKLKLKLKYKIFSLEQAEIIIKKVTKLVGPDTMKVGVGSVVYSAAELAKKDRITELFSGLGSEEIFAGYERHSLAKDINKECWKGLKEMWQRDFTRDYAIADNLKIKLITPFLEPELIKTAMQISGRLKINKQHKKLILREIAQELGLPKEFAWRKKQAAQYGSRFDNAIEKLAKRNGFKYKKEYLDSLH